jgi:hypothetical protein
MFNTRPEIVCVAKADVNVVRVFRCAAPETEAKRFSAILAADKGYSNTIIPLRRGFRVLTDEGQGADGMAVDFI